MFARFIQRFCNEEDGTSSIEAVMWFPLFVGVFCLMTDVALIFNGQTLALRTLQDANRSISVGRLDSASEVASFVETELSNISPKASASATIEAGTVITQVVIPSSDLAVTGWFNTLMDVNLTVRAEHLIEY